MCLLILTITDVKDYITLPLYDILKVKNVRKKIKIVLIKYI